MNVMSSILKLTYNTLEVGYLSIEAEHHLKRLFATDRCVDEQSALIAGQVKREADLIDHLVSVG